MLVGKDVGSRPHFRAHRPKCRNCLEHTFVLMPVSAMFHLFFQFPSSWNTEMFSRDNKCLAVFLFVVMMQWIEI
jgi:hypothetical protein